MSSDNFSDPTVGHTAVEAFRQAFERLKLNAPRLLPPGTNVSQNNVAREAGRTPSALRKERFPDLVREIQAYVCLPSNKMPTTKEKLDRAIQKKRILAEKQALLKKREASAEGRVITLLAEMAELRRQILILEQRLNQGKIVEFRKLD